MPILEVKDLTVDYATVRALDSVSLHVEAGEIVSVIGPNGAGKSTALNAICGVIQLTGKISGQIIFEGKNIKNLQPYELAKKGLCLIPEGRRIFSTMSVLENLEIGAYTLDDKRKIQEALGKVFTIFPDLKERQNQRAGVLSSGEQQMLAIGRALMVKPRLLLVDEPSIGLSPNYVGLVFEKLKEMNKDGVAILLVEQNARMALQYSDRSYVFEIGKIVKEGSSKELLENKKIRKSYLMG